MALIKVLPPKGNISFLTAEDMKKTVFENRNDLYNPLYKLYLFTDDQDALCSCVVEEVYAKQLCHQAPQENTQCWSHPLEFRHKIIDEDIMQYLSSLYYLPGWIIADQNAYK